MVAPVVVCDRSGRRLDRASWFAPESHRRADDFLAAATAARALGEHFFCKLLLSRQCRRIFEPGVAIECRSCYPGFYQTISSRHARNVGKSLYRNDYRRAGEYVSHGSVGSGHITGCHLRAIWTHAFAKAVRYQEKRGLGGRSCDSLGADRARSGDSFGATTEPLAGGEPTDSR